MIFAGRGLVVSLAFFTVAYSVLSLLALLVWRGLGLLFRGRSVPLSAGFLFGLRVLPFAVSAATALFLAFPSFLLLESHTMDEVLRTFALSGCGLLFLGAGLYRVTTAEARTRRVVSAYLEGASGLPTGGAVSALISPRTLLPLMLIGIRTPRILISEAAHQVLSDAELRAALRHESEHLRARDNLREAMVNCIPFPGMGGLERTWREAVELAADRSSVSNREEALDLAAALIKLSRHFAPQAVPAFTTGLAGGAAALGKRVECLLAWKPAPNPPRTHWRYALALAGAAIVLSAVNLRPALILVHSLTERLVP